MNQLALIITISESDGAINSVTKGVYLALACCGSQNTHYMLMRLLANEDWVSIVSRNGLAPFWCQDHNSKRFWLIHIIVDYISKKCMLSRIFPKLEYFKILTSSKVSNSFFEHNRTEVIVCEQTIIIFRSVPVYRMTSEAWVSILSRNRLGIMGAKTISWINAD